MSLISLKRPTNAAWEPIVNRAWQLGIVDAIQLTTYPGLDSPTPPESFGQGAHSGASEITWTLHAKHTLFGAALLWDISWRARQATCGLLIPGIANLTNPDGLLIPNQKLDTLDVLYNSLYHLAETAFGQLNLVRLNLYCDAQSPYLSVFEEVGFVREGTLKRHRFTGGTFHDTVVFGLLRSDLLQEQGLDLGEQP